MQESDTYTTCRLITDGSPSERQEIHANGGEPVEVENLAEHLGDGTLTQDADLYGTGWLDTPDAYWRTDEGQLYGLYR